MNPILIRMSGLKVCRQVMYPLHWSFLLLKHHSEIANVNLGTMHRYYTDCRFTLLAPHPPVVGCDTRLFLMWGAHTRTYNKNCPVLPSTVMQALVSTNSLFLAQREMYCCRSGIPRTSHPSKIFYELPKDRGQE